MTWLEHIPGKEIPHVEPLPDDPPDPPREKAEHRRLANSPFPWSMVIVAGAAVVVVVSVLKYLGIIKLW